MKQKRSNKLQLLMRIWPMHTVATASWLMDNDISYANLQNYVRSGWIEKIDSGTFVRSNDQILWEGAVAGLQNQHKHTFYVGGKTALELLGAAHFIPMKKITLFIFTNERCQLPVWFINYTKDKGIICNYLQYRFLAPHLGVTKYNCGEFSIEISSRERAAFEVVELLGLHHDFEGCRLLFENLSTLRPMLVQELLESCSSIKAKRVFLFLAKNLGHKWFDDLDLKRIDLGSGPREIVSGGAYDPEFKITHPKGLFDDKLEV